MPYFARTEDGVTLDGSAVFDSDKFVIKAEISEEMK